MNEINRWSLFDLIFFDCDSTLSAIEGIDELARFKGKEQRVSVLTQKAMDGELDLRDVYGKRLRAIRPTRGQLKAIEAQYWEHLVPDTVEVLAALRYLQKQTFIISGGLAEPVRGLARKLGVSPDHVRAVELEYNELAGEWWRYYEPGASSAHTYLDYDEGPLTESGGKPDIIRELAGSKRGRRLMIGDGSSDLAARNVVDLFVGFGGVVARPKVREASDVFVTVNSLAPILPIAAGATGYARTVGTPHQAVFDKGIALALDGGVIIKPDDLRGAFEAAFHTIVKLRD